MRRAIFFDRDGTLIYDTRYLSSPDDVRLLPGAIETLRYFRERGFLLVVVSNQSGIGRGYMTEEQAHSVDARFRELLAEGGITLDGVYYCAHAPGSGCACRKPEPGMLYTAAEDLGIDLPGSFIVGDKVTDCQAGRAAGCSAILLVSSGGDPAADGTSTNSDGWTVIRGLTELGGKVQAGAQPATS
jgi:histidinol-phosphate phosphatase family protein